MRNLLIAISVLFVSGCGGGSETGSLMSASTGFAVAADDIQNIDPGTTFSIMATEADLSGGTGPVQIGAARDLSIRYLSDQQFEVTLDGQSYTLDRDPSSSELFATTTTDQTVRLGVFAKGAYAATVRLTIDDFATTDTQVDSMYYDVIGYSTDPAALPATAIYSGDAAFNFQTNQSGDVADGNAFIFADFRGRTLTGSISLSDGTGDGGEGFDVQNLSIELENGTINGNRFSADLNFNGTQLVAGGVQSVEAIALDGGFYGPTGKSAVGTAVGKGTSVGSPTQNNLLVRGRVDLTKQ